MDTYYLIIICVGISYAYAASVDISSLKGSIKIENNKINLTINKNLLENEYFLTNIIIDKLNGNNNRFSIDHRESTIKSKLNYTLRYVKVQSLLSSSTPQALAIKSSLSTTSGSSNNGNNNNMDDFDCKNLDFFNNVNEFNIDVKSILTSLNVLTDNLYLVVNKENIHDNKNDYKLCLLISDNDPLTLINEGNNAIKLHVRILDTNDNKPMFDSNHYETTIMENQEPPVKLDVNIKASVKNGARITYSIVSIDDYDQINNPFQIDSNTGILSCVKKLSHKKGSSYKLKLAATSNGLHKFTSYASLHIRVLDSNEYSPKIRFLFADSIFAYDFTDILHTNDSLFENQDETRISESTLDGSFICYMLITDLNLLKSSKLNVNISGNDVDEFLLEKVDFGSTSFMVTSDDDSSMPLLSLYSLKLAKKLDREKKDRYDIMFEVSDVTEHLMLNASKWLRVIVIDVNDNAPSFEETSYEFDILENKEKSCLGKVRAFDPDLGINGTVKYVFNKNASGCSHTLDKRYKTNREDLVLPFELDENSGEICSTTSLDREYCNKYILKVSAKDCGLVPLQSNEIEVNIVVNDENDNAPRFYQQDVFDNLGNSSDNIIRYYIAENSPVGTYIGWTAAYDLDSKQYSYIDYELVLVKKEGTMHESSGRYVNSKDQEYFEIDSNGIIRSKKVFTQEFLDYEFLMRVIAKDRADPNLRSEIMCSIKVVNENNKPTILLTPNETTIFTPYTNDSTKPLIKITTITSNNKNNNQPQSGTAYKIISNFDFGLNCKQNDVENLFEINSNGELHLINKNINKYDENSIMVCFLNVIVSDAYKETYSLNVELIIVLSNESDRDKLNGIVTQVKEKYDAYKSVFNKQIFTTNSSLNDYYSQNNSSTFKISSIQLFGLGIHHAIIILIISIFSVIGIILVCSCIWIRVNRKRKCAKKCSDNQSSNSNSKEIQAKNLSENHNDSSLYPKLLLNPSSKLLESPSQSSQSDEQISDISTTNSKLTDVEPMIDNYKSNNCTIVWLGKNNNNKQIKNQVNYIDNCEANNCCNTSTTPLGLDQLSSIEQIKNQQVKNNFSQYSNSNNNTLTHKQHHQYSINNNSCENNNNNNYNGNNGICINHLSSTLDNNNKNSHIKSTMYNYSTLNTQQQLQCDADMIATVHWSPSCTPISKPPSNLSVSPSSSTATNTENCCYNRKDPLSNLDEGCYGSSDMSGDSIDAPSSSSLSIVNQHQLNNNNNNNNSSKRNYCGIYHLNTNQTCIVDDDTDSAIQIIKTHFFDSQKLKTKSIIKMNDNSNKEINMNSICNLQLEKFEKIYYEGNNDNKLQVEGSFV